MSTELDHAREIAERIARRVSREEGSSSPAQPKGEVSAELAAVRAGALSIGEADGFAERGGVIGLVVRDDRVKFEINTEAADSTRLRISSKLLALTRVVHSAGAVARP